MAKRMNKPTKKAAAPTKKAKAVPQRAAPLVLSVRLSEHVVLEPAGRNHLSAVVNGYPLDLGRFSEAAAKRAHVLKDGVKLAALAGTKPLDQEIAKLVQLLARQGLVEYVLARRADAHALAVIEPQMPDYRPQIPKLGNGETIVLSRFAYLRRRASEMVLESPRSGALFRIGDPAVVAMLTALAAPQKVGKLRAMSGFPGIELLALLLDCGILFRLDRPDDDGQRPSEGDEALVMWDFHDLLFHARSTEGRQANPLGGVYPYVGWIEPPPAIRPNWPGERIDLQPALAAPAETASAAARLFRSRHSVRDYDDQRPITLAELSLFLDGTARVLSRWESSLDDESDSPVLDYTRRPYPSGGSAYELELYLTVANCDGLATGLYHYDADAHALVAIPARPELLTAMLDSAQFAMDAAGHPQILITVTSRFARLAWKYSAIAYALTLKDVGGLLQTFYLMAADMGLGACAVGTGNIDLFEKVSGIPFHIEGPVGQFTLGRAIDASDAK
ncbi:MULTISPECIES: SagB family peptide dehydrogenase [unclassified Bradyrhizobium]|uniref:SagB/ThcOx family dehydrogenase n=1 Tax=unclassified Bradyrhizobium TaxID=2631580 RepID=UPI0028E7582D|nr:MULTISPECIES: SagB family peptide dehydrogenase [unclassified Bradyrhizobium]